MKRGIQIRDASKVDVDGICAIWCEMMDFHAARDWNFARSKDGESNFGKYICSCLGKDDAHVCVADSEGKIVGYCLGLISKNPPVFERRVFGLISDIAVAEEYRRTGIARALFEDMMAWLRKQGMERVELSVACTNEVAQRFWEGLGFKPYMKKLYKES